MSEQDAQCGCVEEALRRLVDASQNLIVVRSGEFSLRASNDEIRSFMWALTRAEILLDPPNTDNRGSDTPSSGSEA